MYSVADSDAFAPRAELACRAGASNNLCNDGGGCDGAPGCVEVPCLPFPPHRISHATVHGQW